MEKNFKKNEKKIIIIENNKKTFDNLKKNVNEIGEVAITYEEIQSALLGNNISGLVEKKMQKYGKNIVAFIIDLNLNEENCYGGIQIIKEIRNAPASSDEEYWRLIVPIIVCTQYPNYEEKAKKAGANKVIRKVRALEYAEKAFENREEWKEERDLFFTDSFLPVLHGYRDWYNSAMEKIEHAPNSIKLASINFFISYNNPELKHAFVMTSFADEYEHTISSALSSIEQKYYIKSHLADKSYKATTDDLFPYLQSLMHCCDFGIGVFFQDPRTNSINANLSIEVGYMLGIKKEICYLKDVELKEPPADLISKIYTKYKKTKRSKGKDVPTMDEALCKWIDGRSGLKIKKRDDVDS